VPGNSVRDLPSGSALPSVAATGIVATDRHTGKSYDPVNLVTVRDGRIRRGTCCAYPARVAATPAGRTPIRLTSSRPLLGAALVVAGEAIALLALGVLELLSLSADRLAPGLMTTAFFAVYAAALLACAWGLAHERGWSRGPVVLTELIQLGIAWNVAQAATLGVSLLVAAAAVYVLVVAFLPSTTKALYRRR
jgi:hypothetical protein